MVSHHPTKFNDQRDSSSGDTMVFICPVTLQDYAIKALSNFMVKSPTRYITILPSLVAIVTVIVEI